MKDTDMNDTGKSVQPGDAGKEKRKRSRKGRSEINIPGGAGAAGQIPIKGDDKKQRDDPLQPDTTDQEAE